MMATAVVAVLITLGWATPALAQTRNFEAEMQQFSAPEPFRGGVCSPSAVLWCT
jgi:hypothetical protein